MSKKLFLICFIFSVFVGTAFTQEMYFVDSARSKSTAGEYTSDSDNVNAKDIFEIKRTFFSAGYVPQLTGAGSYFGDGISSIGTMSAFWAMPIKTNMTIGFAGEYQMNSTKDIFAGEYPSDAVGAFFYGLNNWSTPSIYEREYLTESSVFSFRPVFRWKNFAFHYRLSRNDADTTTAVESVTTIETEETVYKSTVVNNNPTWEHELGFAYNAKSFKIYVPLGFTINMNGSTVTKMTNSTTEQTTTTNSTTSSKDVVMYINPEFIKYTKLGAMTQFRVGLDMDFRLIGGTYTEHTDTTGGVTTTSPAVEYKAPVYVGFSPYFNPSFEWSFWKGKANFAVDPTVGLRFFTDGVKNTNDDYSYNSVTPYLDVALGTLIRPLEWLEFRTGMKYGLVWENTIFNYDTYNYSTYIFYSIFEVYTGFGFIVTDDFFIDVYVQAGHTVTLANGGEETMSETSLFNINAYGVQLSYRF